MKIYYLDSVYRIQFQVRASVSDIIDRVSFIYLLEAKFNGEVISAHPFWNIVKDKKRKFLHIELQFPNFDQFDGAKYHCQRNLTKGGKIVTRYRGALDAADPGRRQADRIIERALAEKSSN